VTAPEPELPRAFRSADAFSLLGQRRVLRGTSARLVLTVVATLLMAVAPLWPTHVSPDREIELVGIVAAALFLVAFVFELWLLRRRPERDWYDGRAVAESTKTLSWRYAVGGSPYAISADVDVDATFAADVRSLGTDVPPLRADVETGGTATPWMRSLRASDLATRRASYVRDRIADQERWYSTKAAYNLRRARAWSAVLLVSEALGVVLALLKSLGVVSIDFASLAAAVIASGAAWLALKQHESIGAAYTLASAELASVRERLVGLTDESAWAEEVASAEDAVSREHTMWRASRSKPSART
jgi:hypothetical protein